MWYGVGFVPAGLILYGWLVERQVFWVAPLVGASLFGLGLMLVTSNIMPFSCGYQTGGGCFCCGRFELGSEHSGRYQHCFVSDRSDKYWVWMVDDHHGPSVLLGGLFHCDCYLEGRV